MIDNRRRMVNSW